jgi:hypothetical protein
MDQKNYAEAKPFKSGRKRTVIMTCRADPREQEQRVGLND